MSENSLVIGGALALLLNGLLALPLLRWMRARGGQLRAVVLANGVLLSGLLALAATLHQTGLSMEQAPVITWAFISGFSLLAGLLLAKTSRRMASAEFGVAFVLSIEVATAMLLVSSGEHAMASAPVRTLLVGPAVGALWGYFGLSFGYLAWANGPRTTWLGYEAMIGRRFLLSKSSSAVSTVTTISVVGVALGVWLVIISLAILGGFESDLQRKIIGANAHAQVKAARGEGFPLQPDHEKTLLASPSIASASPFIEGEVAFAGNANYVGGLLLGVDPAKSSQVLDVFQTMVSGSLAGLTRESVSAEADPSAEFAAPAPIPGVILGVEMAKSLNVVRGDRVNVISPVLEVLTPFGPAPRILGFEVVGIFDTRMYEYDARYAYITLESARRFFMLPPSEVTGLHLKLSDPEAVAPAANYVQAHLGAEFATEDWMQRNQTLFSALKLERIIAFVVLAFIILVASFSIVNTLTMSIIEKQKEIAILRTMGAHSTGIMKLFLIQGMLIGGFGALLGGAAGSLSALGLQRFGLWIPNDVYYIDSLPVNLENADVVMVVLAALLIVWDFAVFPAFRGAQLQPVEGLREG